MAPLSPEVDKARIYALNAVGPSILTYWGGGNFQAIRTKKYPIGRNGYLVSPDAAID